VNESLERLARWVAQVKRVSAELAEQAALPPEDAPFLRAQLASAVADLERSARSWTGAPEPARRERPEGLLGRMMRSFARGLGDRSREEAPFQADCDGLAGTSWTVPLPDLIGFLAQSNKTGLLRVYTPFEVILIELRDGDLIHASSDVPTAGPRIGDVLVGQEVISQDTLDRFLAQRKGDTRMLGTALCDSGLVSERELERALGHQVQQIFHRLMGAENALFRFQAGEHHLSGHRVQLNATHLILESARVRDERDEREGRAQNEALAVLEEPAPLELPAPLPEPLADDAEDDARAASRPEAGDGVAEAETGAGAAQRGSASTT